MSYKYYGHESDRVARVFLSVRDAATGNVLGSATVRLHSSGATAYTLSKPGEHALMLPADVATLDCRLALECPGYALFGPTTVELERSREGDAVPSLEVLARRTQVRVEARDFRTGERLDVDVTLTGNKLVLLTGRRVGDVELGMQYRLEARCAGMRQATRFSPMTFDAAAFTNGECGPLKLRVDMEPVTAHRSSVDHGPLLPALGWVRLKKEQEQKVEEFGECDVEVDVLDVTDPASPKRLSGAGVRIGSLLAGFVGDGALKRRFAAPRSSAVMLKVTVEMRHFAPADDATANAVLELKHSKGTQIFITMRVVRTVIAVRVLAEHEDSPLAGDVTLSVEPVDSRVATPALTTCSSAGAVHCDIEHAQATFFGTVVTKVSTRINNDEEIDDFVYDVENQGVVYHRLRASAIVGGSKDFFFRTTPYEVGELVVAKHAHRGRYRIVAKGRGYRQVKSSERCFTARDFLRGRVQVDIRMERSLASFVLVGVIDVDTGKRVRDCSVSMSARDGTFEDSEDDTLSVSAAELPRRIDLDCQRDSCLLDCYVESSHYVQVPPRQCRVALLLDDDEPQRLTLLVRRAQVRVEAILGTSKRLQKATLEIEELRDDHDDERGRMVVKVKPGELLSLRPESRYAIRASLNKHRQLSLLNPFVLSSSLFRNMQDFKPVTLAVQMCVTVGALQVEILDAVTSESLKEEEELHFEVSVVEPSTKLTLLRRDYSSSQQKMQLELPVTTEERELQVEVCGFGFLQVGGPLSVGLSAGRLRKAKVKMRRTEVALVLRDTRLPGYLKKRLRIELVSHGQLSSTFQQHEKKQQQRNCDESARKWAAKHSVFGSVATVATGCAYELRLASDSDFKLVSPTEQLFFQPGDFSIGEEPLTKISSALARLRAALPIEVVVEPLNVSLLLDVIDAATGENARDVNVTLKTAPSTFYNLGLRRGVIHGLPLKGGGDEVDVSVACEAHGRVQLAPYRATARAGAKLALKLFVRTSTLQIRVHDAASSNPDRRVLGSEVTLTANNNNNEVLEFLDDDDEHVVAVGREYRISLKAARARHRGPLSFRCDASDYVELSVDEPLICHVYCEANEADVDLDVADLATGALLPRAHVQLGPHSLGVQRGLLPVAIRESREVWPLGVTLRGWCLAGPAEVSVVATDVCINGGGGGAKRATRIRALLRLCEVVATVTDGSEVLPAARVTLRQQGSSDFGVVPTVDEIKRLRKVAKCVVDVAGPMRGSIISARHAFDTDTEERGIVAGSSFSTEGAQDAYDVKTYDFDGTVVDDAGPPQKRGSPMAYDVTYDDGTVDLNLEAWRFEAVLPGRLNLGDRVVVFDRPEAPGVYELNVHCEGYRHDPKILRFTATDFLRLAPREPYMVHAQMTPAEAHKIEVTAVDAAGEPLKARVFIGFVDEKPGSSATEAEWRAWAREHSTIDLGSSSRVTKIPREEENNCVSIYCSLAGHVQVGPVFSAQLERRGTTRLTVTMLRTAVLVTLRDALTSSKPLPPNVKVALFKKKHYVGAYAEAPAPAHDSSDIVEEEDHASWTTWRDLGLTPVDFDEEYTLQIFDPSKEVMQVTHCETLIFKSPDDFLPVGDALRLHRRALLEEEEEEAVIKEDYWHYFWQKRPKKEKPGPVSSGAVAARALQLRRREEAATRVAVLNVLAGPALVDLEIKVVDSDMAPLEGAGLTLGRLKTLSSSSGGRCEWSKILGDAATVKKFRAHVARAKDRGFPVEIRASLAGYVQISDSKVPLVLVGRTRVLVVMRQSLLTIKAVDSVTKEAVVEEEEDLHSIIELRTSEGEPAPLPAVEMNRAYWPFVRSDHLVLVRPESVVFDPALWKHGTPELVVELGRKSHLDATLRCVTHLNQTITDVKWRLVLVGETGPTANPFRLGSHPAKAGSKCRVEISDGEWDLTAESAAAVFEIMIGGSPSVLLDVEVQPNTLLAIVEPGEECAVEAAVNIDEPPTTFFKRTFTHEEMEKHEEEPIVWDIVALPSKNINMLLVVDDDSGKPLAGAELLLNNNEEVVSASQPIQLLGEGRVVEKADLPGYVNVTQLPAPCCGEIIIRMARTMVVPILVDADNNEVTLPNAVVSLRKVEDYRSLLGKFGSRGFLDRGEFNQAVEATLGLVDTDTEQIFASFDDGGKVSFDEFARYLDSVDSAMQKLRGLPPFFVKKVFDQNSGTLSVDELKIGLKQLGIEEVLDDIVNQFSSTTTERITYEAFVAALRGDKKQESAKLLPEAVSTSLISAMRERRSTKAAKVTTAVVLRTDPGAPVHLPEFAKYVIHVESETMRHVRDSKEMVEFTAADSYPFELRVVMTRVAQIIVLDVRDEQQGAPLPEATLELGRHFYGTRRGLVDDLTEENCSLFCELPGYVQLTPTRLHLDLSRPVSLVVLMRRALVQIVVLDDEQGEDLYDNTIKPVVSLTCQKKKQALLLWHEGTQVFQVLTRAEYKLKVKCKGRLPLERTLRFEPALFTQFEQEIFKYVVRLVKSTATVQLTVRDAVTHEPLPDASVTMGKASVGTTRGDVTLTLSNCCLGLPVTAKLDYYAMMCGPFTLTMSQGRDNVAALEMRPATVSVQSDHYPVELVKSTDGGTTMLTFTDSTVQHPVILEDTTYAWGATRRRFKAGDWSGLEPGEPLVLILIANKESISIIHVEVTDERGRLLPLANLWWEKSENGETQDLGQQRDLSEERGLVRASLPGYVQLCDDVVVTKGGVKLVMRACRIELRVVDGGAHASLRQPLPMCTAELDYSSGGSRVGVTYSWADQTLGPHYAAKRVRALVEEGDKVLATFERRLTVPILQAWINIEKQQQHDTQIGSRVRSLLLGCLDHHLESWIDGEEDDSISTGAFARGVLSLDTTGTFTTTASELSDLATTIIMMLSDDRVAVQLNPQWWRSSEVVVLELELEPTMGEVVIDAVDWRGVQRHGLLRMMIEEEHNDHAAPADLQLARSKEEEHENERCTGLFHVRPSNNKDLQLAINLTHNESVSTFGTARVKAGCRANCLLRIEKQEEQLLVLQQKRSVRKKEEGLLELRSSAARALSDFDEHDDDEIGSEFEVECSADLAGYVLLDPLSSCSLALSCDIQRRPQKLQFTMRRAEICVSLMDARFPGRFLPKEAKVTLVSSSSSTKASSTTTSVVGEALVLPVDPAFQYEVRVEAEGYRQLTLLESCTFEPSLFSERGRDDDHELLLEAGTPLPLRCELEPTAVELEVTVISTGDGDDLPDANVSIGGIDIGLKRGRVLLDMAALRERGALRSWLLLEDNEIVLPLQAAANLEGWVPGSVRVMAGSVGGSRASSSCRIVMRRAEVVFRGYVGDEPVVECPPCTLIHHGGDDEPQIIHHFGQATSQTFTDWLEKKKQSLLARSLCGNRDAILKRLPASRKRLQTILTEVVSKKDFFKKIGGDIVFDNFKRGPRDNNNVSSKVAAPRRGPVISAEDIALAVEEMCPLKLVVRTGLRYTLRLEEQDIYALEEQQVMMMVFSASDWSSSSIKSEALVVRLQLRPTYADVAVRVLDAATLIDLPGARLRVGERDIGAKRAARLPCCQGGGGALVVVATLNGYAQLPPPTALQLLLLPGAQASVVVKMRRCRVSLRAVDNNTRGGRVVLEGVRLGLANHREAEVDGCFLVSVGASYTTELLERHPTYVRKKPPAPFVLSAACFLCQDICNVDVEMVERGPRLRLSVVLAEENKEEELVDAAVTVGGHYLGKSRGSIDEDFFFFFQNFSARCELPGYILVAAQCSSSNKMRSPKGPLLRQAVVDADGGSRVDLQDLVVVEEQQHGGTRRDDIELVLKMRPLKVTVRVLGLSEVSLDKAVVRLIPQDCCLDGGLLPIFLMGIKLDDEEQSFLVQLDKMCAGGYQVVVSHIASLRQRVPVHVGLEDFLTEKAVTSVQVEMVTIQGSIDLSVDGGPEAHVTIGMHRLGSLRGPIQLIEVAGGGKPIELPVIARLLNYVQDCSSIQLRAGATTALKLSMREALVSFTAVDARTKEHLNAKVVVTLTTLKSSLSSAGNFTVRVGHPCSATIVSSSNKTLDLRLDDLPEEEEQQHGVPSHLVTRRIGDRCLVPEASYFVECEVPGYRQLTHRCLSKLEPVVFLPEDFNGKAREILMEPAECELVFNITDTAGQPLDARLWVDEEEVHGGSMALSKKKKKKKKKTVIIRAELDGYLQLAPTISELTVVDAGVQIITVKMDCFLVHVLVLTEEGVPIIDKATISFNERKQEQPLILDSFEKEWSLVVEYRDWKQTTHLSTLTFAEKDFSAEVKQGAKTTAAERFHVQMESIQYRAAWLKWRAERQPRQQQHGRHCRLVVTMARPSNPTFNLQVEILDTDNEPLEEALLIFNDEDRGRERKAEVDGSTKKLVHLSALLDGHHLAEATFDDEQILPLVRNVASCFLLKEQSHVVLRMRPHKVAIKVFETNPAPLRHCAVFSAKKGDRRIAGYFEFTTKGQKGTIEGSYYGERGGLPMRGTVDAHGVKITFDSRLLSSGRGLEPPVTDSLLLKSEDGEEAWQLTILRWVDARLFFNGGKKKERLLATTTSSLSEAAAPSSTAAPAPAPKGEEAVDAFLQAWRGLEEEEEAPFLLPRVTRHVDETTGHEYLNDEATGVSQWVGDIVKDDEQVSLEWQGEEKQATLVRSGGPGYLIRCADPLKRVSKWRFGEDDDWQKTGLVTFQDADFPLQLQVGLVSALMRLEVVDTNGALLPGATVNGGVDAKSSKVTLAGYVQLSRTATEDCLRIVMRPCFVRVDVEGASNATYRIVYEQGSSINASSGEKVSVIVDRRCKVVCRCLGYEQADFLDWRQFASKDLLEEDSVLKIKMRSALCTVTVRCFEGERLLENCRVTFTADGVEHEAVQPGVGYKVRVDAPCMRQLDHLNEIFFEPQQTVLDIKLVLEAVFVDVTVLDAETRKQLCANVTIDGQEGLVVNIPKGSGDYTFEASASVERYCSLTTTMKVPRRLASTDVLLEREIPSLIMELQPARVTLSAFEEDGRLLEAKTQLRLLDGDEVLRGETVLVLLGQRYEASAEMPGMICHPEIVTFSSACDCKISMERQKFTVTLRSDDDMDDVELAIDDGEFSRRREFERAGAKKCVSFQVKAPRHLLVGSSSREVEDHMELLMRPASVTCRVFDDVDVEVEVFGATCPGGLLMYDGGAGSKTLHLELNTTYRIVASHASMRQISEREFVLRPEDFASLLPSEPHCLLVRMAHLSPATINLTCEPENGGAIVEVVSNNVVQQVIGVRRGLIEVQVADTKELQLRARLKGWVQLPPDRFSVFDEEAVTVNLTMAPALVRIEPVDATTGALLLIECTTVLEAAEGAVLQAGVVDLGVEYAIKCSSTGMRQESPMRSVVFSEEDFDMVTGVATVQVRMEPCRAKLRVRVLTDADGAVLPGASISLLRGSRGEMSGLPQNRAFYLDDLPKGESAALVLARLAHFIQVSPREPMRLSPGASYENLECRLRPTTVRYHAVDERTGLRLSPGRVTLRPLLSDKLLTVPDSGPGLRIALRHSPSARVIKEMTEKQQGFYLLLDDDGEQFVAPLEGGAFSPGEVVEVHPTGSYVLEATLLGYSTISFTRTFRTDDFLDLEPVEEEAAPELEDEVTMRAVLMRFREPAASRCLRSWRKKAAESDVPSKRKYSAPLTMQLRFRMSVGDVELSVEDEEQNVRLDSAVVSLDGRALVGRGLLQDVEMGGAGGPWQARVKCELPGYFLSSPAACEVRCGALTQLKLQMRRFGVKALLLHADDGSPFLASAELRLYKEEELVGQAFKNEHTFYGITSPSQEHRLVATSRLYRQLGQAATCPAEEHLSELLTAEMAPAALELVVECVDARTGEAVPEALISVGEAWIGAKRGLLTLSAWDFSDEDYFLSREPFEAAVFVVNDDEPLFSVQESLSAISLLPGGRSVLTVKLRRLTVSIVACARVDHTLVALHDDVQVALFRDQLVVQGCVLLGEEYLVRASSEKYRQKTVLAPLSFKACHFTDELKQDHLEIVVEMELRTFSALVRCVDESSGEILTDALLILGGLTGEHREYHLTNPGYSYVSVEVDMRGPCLFLGATAVAHNYSSCSSQRVELRNDGRVPAVTLLLRKAALEIEVRDDLELALPDPLIQLRRLESSSRQQERRPRRALLVLLNGAHSVRAWSLGVDGDAMRQRDLLAPQHWCLDDLLATFVAHLAPLRCAVDLTVVDAENNALPDANVRLGDLPIGTQRGLLFLDLNDAIVL